MVHAEGYLTLNMALCCCALLLGGKLAGVAAPARKRLLWAGALSAVSSLAALLPRPWDALGLASLPLSAWLCFGVNGWQACVRCTLTTLCAGLLTGGACLWLWALGLPDAVSLGLGALLSVALYLLAKLLPTVHCDVHQVELCVDGHGVLLPAMLDSGNLLRDPVTGLPVLVAPARALRPLFPGRRDLDLPSALEPGFRLLSVKTATGGGLWPMFKPDLCKLYQNGRASEARLMVAVAGREYGGVQALVPMAAIPNRLT